MIKINKVPPSVESKQPLKQPTVVINRVLAINSTIESHQHLWGQFIYASKGVLAVNTTSDRYIVPPEQGVWVPPQINHEVTAISDVTLTSFYFDNKLIDNLPVTCCVLQVSVFLKALIQEAASINANYLWRSSDGRLLRLIIDRLAIAKHVLLQLPYPRDRRLITLVTQLQLTPENNNSLHQWGNILGASARTLSRRFKNETGLSYSEWRQKLYLQLAITRLYAGETVTNISLALGYESPSAFIYMFKKQLGASPNQYLKKYLKKNSH